LAREIGNSIVLGARFWLIS